MSYWDQRAELRKQAMYHTDLMEEQYKKEILNCLNWTQVYDDRLQADTKGSSAIQMLVNTDSISAVFGLREKYPEAKIMLQNFSSYKEPGGKFLDGSSAQEECLCHASYLYNVLRLINMFYDKNNEHLNKAMYENRALYTPSVRFFNLQGMSRFSDVLTLAAPNYKAAVRFCRVSSEENQKTMESRIHFINRIAAFNSVDIIIAGAYGCGVFGQNPADVARMYRDEFKNTKAKLIVYAVPGALNSKNFGEFHKVFGDNPQQY